MRNVSLLYFLMIGLLLLGQSASLVHVSQHHDQTVSHGSHVHLTGPVSLAQLHKPHGDPSPVDTDCLAFHVVASTSGLVFVGTTLSAPFVEQSRITPVPVLENLYREYYHSSIRAPPTIS